MMSDTIVVAPLHGLRGTADVESLRAPSPESTAAEQAARMFRIRSADSYVYREAANSLLQERYAWRGYHAVSLPADQTTNRITLTAVEQEATIGTITVALDGPEGLSADDAFAKEMSALRQAGQRVCEFTKLAVDPNLGSQSVLAALFHVAYIVAHRMRGYDMLVMEVNPRHVRYYERKLGARIIGEQRLNRFVNAPAVLLAIDFEYVSEQIAAFGGQPETSANERSLYPRFFSVREEQGIVGRMMKAQVPASASVN